MRKVANLDEGMKAGDFVRVKVIYGLGYKKKPTISFGVLISYTEIAPNMYDEFCKIRLLETTGELKELSLFYGDEIEVVI